MDDGAAVPHDEAQPDALEGVDADAPEGDEPAPVDPTDEAVEADERRGPALERGMCPLCEAEFDDRQQFRDHLGEVHELYDDEGKETDFLPPFFDPVPVTPPPVRRPPPHPRQVRPAPPPATDADRRRRRVAASALVLVLVAGAVVGLALTGSDDEPGSLAAGSRGTTSASVHAATETTKAGTEPAKGTAKPSQPAGPATPSTTSAPRATTTTAAPPPAPAAPPAAAPPTTAAPRPTTTTTTQSTPPPSFDPPSATSARIDICDRDGNAWIISFSWDFVGGAAWQPLPAYNAVGGKRYQHTVTVPRNRDTAITTVQVTDPAGTRHNVRLQPQLTSASCRR